MLEQQPAPPLLLADAMLGRLCKWLRLLGHDVLYASSWSDHEIVARARAEGRLVLTRDTALAQRRGIRSLWVHSQALEEQMAEVLAAIGCPPPHACPRCPKCNAPLQAVPPEQVKAFVPAYIFRTQRDFTYCSTCSQYYWPGSHWQQVLVTLERVSRDAHRPCQVEYNGE